MEAVVAPCREGEGTDKAYGVENVESGSEIEDVRLQLTVLCRRMSYVKKREDDEDKEERIRYFSSEDVWDNDFYSYGNDML